ncbi:cadherin domain-containing protein [Microvirga terricola]|uniref:Cadherin domain-containing protein n=1 Tax=Microvirga terricola TaxID=2719797 RepID=A0ABX0V787_9HYPH|nr:cadherin domain-containing protein [Microvirga terricola]NIX75674.1 hypothetical protein [Microvirga terricola]
MTIVTEWGSKDPFLINTTTDLSQSKGRVVALKDGTFLVVWEHTRLTSPGATSSETDIYGQIFNADGTKKGGELVINGRAGNQMDPKVAVLADGRVVVTWVDKSGFSEAGGDIRAQVLNVDGTPSGSDFAVNTATAGIQQDPVIAALADGGFVVSWTTWAGSDPDIRSQAFKAPVGTAVPEKASPTEVNVNTTTFLPQMTPTVAGLSNGNYVVLYYDVSGGTSGLPPTIRGRILKPDGTPAVDASNNPIAEFAVAKSLGQKSLPKVVALADGRFLATWNYDDPESGDGSGFSVKGQLFNADGTKAGGDFVVNTSTEGNQKFSSIVALSDGGFAAAYADFGPQTGIRVAIFNSKGLRADEDYFLPMPIVESVDETKPLPGKANVAANAISLAALEDGRLVLTWAENGWRPEDMAGVYGIILEPRNKGVTLGGNGLDNNYIGTKYADVMFGQAGIDNLRGEDGDDILVGGSGADVLNGGSGRDTASYVDAAASVTANLRTPGLNTGDATDDTYISVENLTGSAFGDTLSGDDGDNVLDGWSGSDSLVGGGGADVLIGGDSATDTDNDDTLDGGIGADTMIGGKGNDTYYVDNAGDKVVEAVGGGRDVVHTSVSYALEAGLEIEELRAAGGTAVINLTGNEFANSLYGNGAANELNGGAGADYMEGGAGDDTYYVDDQGDVVVEAFDQGVDTLVITKDFARDSTYNLGAYANMDDMRAFNEAGNVALIGNSGANRITGNDGHNRLDGGNDTLVDTLAGGKGDDTYVIRHEGDVLVELNAEGTDTALVATSSFTLRKDVSIEVIQADKSSGVTNFTLTGNNLANTIKGGDDDDVLDGGGAANDAADRLEGGLGNDTYHVRHGGDVVVEAADGGADDKIIAHTSYTLGAGVFVETLEAATGSATIALTGNAEGNVIIGNAGDNVLEGRGGNDTIDGGGGLNTVVFTGVKADYTITKNLDGTVTIADKQAGRDGTDLIKSVKYARFSDEIVDLQARPTLSITATDAVKLEGSDGSWVDYTFTVTRSNTEGGPTARWTVTGLSDDEILAREGTVTFNPGVTTTTITIKIKADTLIEDNEVFTVALSDASGATIANGTATGTVINDDTLPALSIVAEDAVKLEGNDSAFTEFTFVVTRSSGFGPSSVNWTASGYGPNPTSDDDFEINPLTGKVSGTVVFANGETSKIIKVKIKVDTQFEQNEGFIVTLSDPTDAVIANGSATGVILNDDASSAADTAPTDLRLTTGEAVASINENLAAGQIVARVMANDNASASELRYYIAENANFVIDELTGEIKVKHGAVLDYEKTKTYTMAVTVKDRNGAGQQTTENIVINLVDVNEAATDIAFTSLQVVKAGMTSAGANVVLATAIDPDAPAEFQKALYRFANGATTDGIFSIDVNTGQIVTNRAVSAEDVGEHTLNVVTYDATNMILSSTKSYTVKVAPAANQAPSSIALTTGGTVALADEHTWGGTIVAQAVSYDDGGAAGLRYSMTDNTFEIDALTGQIRVKSGLVLDFEAQSTHTFAVTATDAEGLSTTGNITINIVDKLDIWRGTARKDVLVGTNGPDRFYGGSGNDKLIGGQGQDIFVFDSKLGTAKTNPKKNFDTIVDFNVADDGIWLDDKVFNNKDMKKLGKGANELKPKQLNKNFFSLDKAKDANDYIVYNRKTGVLYYDPDGSGDKQAIAIAKLSKKLKMTYKDFFIV